MSKIKREESIGPLPISKGQGEEVLARRLRKM